MATDLRIRNKITILMKKRGKGGRPIKVKNKTGEFEVVIKKYKVIV